MANTTTLDEKGYGLCCICHRKLFISEIESCFYCDKWVCKEHKVKSQGRTLCAKCYAENKNNK